MDLARRIRLRGPRDGPDYSSRKEGRLARLNELANEPLANAGGTQRLYPRTMDGPISDLVKFRRPDARPAGKYASAADSRT